MGLKLSHLFFISLLFHLLFLGGAYFAAPPSGDPAGVSLPVALVSMEGGQGGENAGSGAASRAPFGSALPSGRLPLSPPAGPPPPIRAPLHSPSTAAAPKKEISAPPAKAPQVAAASPRPDAIVPPRPLTVGPESPYETLPAAAPASDPSGTAGEEGAGAWGGEATAAGAVGPDGGGGGDPSAEGGGLFGLAGGGDGTAPRMEMPRPAGRSNSKPRYPEAARAEGREGTVVLRVTVLPSGKVGEVAVDRSSDHPDLDRSAVEAVTKWRFLPARRGEEPVPASVRIPVTFALDDP